MPIELEITSLRTSFSRMCNKEETHAQRLVQLETLDEKRHNNATKCSYQEEEEARTQRRKLGHEV